MNKYNWRKNFTAAYSHQDSVIRGKLAIKTEELHWLETTKPVVILISVHSKFHEVIGGNLKINALISTIKNHVKGPVTILLSDMAHLQTQSLNYGGNLDLAFEECLERGQEIVCRYKPYFENCEVVYWHSYIRQNSHFLSFYNSIKKAYHTNQIFRELVHQDAESTYTSERKEKYQDKDLFIEKAREDILEQCTSVMVLSREGYAFQFYSDSSFRSVEYVNRTFLSEENRVSWIKVFLSIEKKTIISAKEASEIQECLSS